MPVKFLQYWNVRPDDRKEFDAFFTLEFAPGFRQSGLMTVTGSWQVASGEGPNFIAESVAGSLGQAEDLIMGPDFRALKQKLMPLVSDYATKLLVPAGPVENRGDDLERGFKFTQHYNVNSADHYEYMDFQQNRYLPALAEFGLETIGVWSVAIGATPYVINESRARDLGLIGRMLESETYQDLNLGLLRMVTNYGCKVLVPSGHLNA